MPLNQHLCSTFKKRAPRAVRAIRKFATEMMGTSDVRVHPQLNKAVWTKGVKNVPHRIRVRCERRRNDDEVCTDFFGDSTYMRFRDREESPMCGELLASWVTRRTTVVSSCASLDFNFNSHHLS